MGCEFLGLKVCLSFWGRSEIKEGKFLETFECDLIRRWILVSPPPLLRFTWGSSLPFSEAQLLPAASAGAQLMCE